MIRSILWAAPLALAVTGLLHAQDATALNDLKAKIWEAELAQRNFAAGLRHCSELNGTNFYFYPHDRVPNLQDYRRSLDNFAIQGAFNPETKRPWNKQDADARWALVQKQAITDDSIGSSRFRTMIQSVARPLTLFRASSARQTMLAYADS
jgi:hypothetical protein